MRLQALRSKALSDFVNPRIPPNPGQPIYLASSETLSEMLSPKQMAESGSAHIGSLLTREQGEVPVVLSVAASSVAATMSSLISLEDNVTNSPSPMRVKIVCFIYLCSQARICSILSPSLTPSRQGGKQEASP